jgi:hypothetical protein|tara:strand:+ start:807 stop:1076 length:270 start_codon:yes stop_codon:yes gene_type:complete
MKKFIHVDKGLIGSFHHRTHNFKDAVIVVSTEKEANKYYHEVKILGESKVVYSPIKTLNMQEELLELGKSKRIPRIRCWIETEADIQAI